MNRVLIALAGTAALGVVGLGVAYAAVDVPVAKASARQEASVLQYADGSELARVGSLDRENVRLGEVSEAAQHAVLAAEQRGYWTEPGVSPRAILRAAWANLRGGGVSQGGSTITQQYVKNAYLSDERTFSRKAKEAVVALKLSRSRSKQQVLEDYLNTVYFGRGAYGVQVAAKTWFGKPAKDLTGAEGAVLAALLKSPSGYDPAKNPQDARARWEYVLDGMVAEGWMTREERAAAVYPAVRKGAKSAADDRSGPRGYVVEMVEAELARVGFREGSLQQGGLTVRTTLRRDAQAAAVAAVQDVVPAPDREDQAAVQGALVAVRPGTGEVYAWYGGRAGDGGFDYAQARQDAGSTMKAYVLAAALEKGIGLGTRLDGDSPKSVPGYSKPVRNFGDSDHGQVDLVDATAKSVNTAYVALAAEVGPQAVADVAHRVGVRPTDRLSEPEGPPSLGIALGVYGLRPVDQANAMATFAAGGVRSAPHAVLSVEAAGGTTVYEAERVTERVLAGDVCADVTFALQQVVARGTASGKGRLAEGRPAIGKTGTTQGSRDAWMVGATPQLSAAVWVGRGDDEPMTGVLGSSGGVTGGGAPARIWKAFLDATLEGDPVQRFPGKAGVGAPLTPSPTATPSSSPTPTPSATPLEVLVLPSATADPLPTYGTTDEQAYEPAYEEPAEQPYSEPTPAPYGDPYTEPTPAPPPGDSSVDADTAPTAQPTKGRRGRG